MGQRYGEPDRVTDERYILGARRLEQALEEALRAFLYDLGAAHERLEPFEGFHVSGIHAPAEQVVHL